MADTIRRHFPIVDSHHHLWRYSKEDYPWIPAGSPLAQDQLVPELEVVTSGSGVTGTVVIQARQIVEESDFLLSLADQTEQVMFGTDWPVCLLRTRYMDWAETVRGLTASLSAAERDAILTGNAARCYG